MFNKKIISIFFVILSLLFIRFVSLREKPQMEIVSVFEDENSLKLNLEINKKFNSLIFSSKESIENILFFDKEGNMIKKIKPTSNVILLNEFKQQDIYITFISNDKISFKSIIY